MMKNKNINKGAFYYLIKNKDTIITNIIMIPIALLFTFVLMSNTMESRGVDYIILVFYILVLGIMVIQENSLAMELTVKDKLNRRLELFLSHNISLKNIILSYTKEIFKISIIVPIFIFIYFNIKSNISINFIEILTIFITTMILAYVILLLINTLALTIKKHKLFKDILFFGNFIIIYLVANLSEYIIEFLRIHSIFLPYLIIFINILASIIILIIVGIRLKKLDNELIVKGESLWD